MKKAPLYPALLLLVLNSCSKNNSGNNNPPPAYYLSSVVATVPMQRLVDSFYYDSLHRIDTFSQSVYDTLGPGNVLYNKFSLQFLYDGSKTAPSWYNYYDIPYGNYGDYHLLSYDAEGRISKDTSLSGSGFVTFFTYPNNNVVTVVYPEGNPENNSIDTLYMTNGNITRHALYTAVIPGQPDVSSGSTTFTDASTANPAYHEAISAAFGPLLFAWTLSHNTFDVDFVSKNTWQGISGASATSPLGIPAVTYTLTNDGRGRLQKMTAGPAGAPMANMVFSYY